LLSFICSSIPEARPSRSQLALFELVGSRLSLWEAMADSKAFMSMGLPTEPPCQQILGALQLKYSRHGYINHVIIGLNMELERLVAFRSYRSSSHSTMIAELPLKWHGMWRVYKKGTIGVVFHYNADMIKACHHLFISVCDGIMKYTDADQSELLVEVSVFVGRRNLGISDSAEIVDSAESEWIFAAIDL
jgi:hypothetical protein